MHQHAPSHHVREKGRGSRPSDYLPLAVVVVLSGAAAAALQYSFPLPPMSGWMPDFMGFFLIIFAMFKFFDLEGFADGFQMYDLLAKPFRPYAYVYPFLEAALGLGFLSRWNPGFVSGAAFVLLLFGAAGVCNALRKGLDIECACMGSILHVPLSTVALIEDLGMAVMSALMLYRYVESIGQA